MKTQFIEERCKVCKKMLRAYSKQTLKYNMDAHMRKHQKNKQEDLRG